MITAEQRERFQKIVMPHLDAAYNLARWIMRNGHDAEDVTHEAFVRAMKFFGSFRGEQGKPWLLAIVRNTCMTHLQRTSQRATDVLEEVHEAAESATCAWQPDRDNPEIQLLQKASAELVNKGLARLPTELREVLVLRELEDLSYKEIADVVQTPIGTVMSRLHRARRLLREELERLDEALQR